MLKLFLCEAREPKRSIVSLCEHFAIRRLVQKESSRTILQPPHFVIGYNLFESFITFFGLVVHLEVVAEHLCKHLPKTSNKTSAKILNNLICRMICFTINQLQQHLTLGVYCLINAFCNSFASFSCSFLFFTASSWRSIFSISACACFANG